MTQFASLEELREACLNLPDGDESAAQAVRDRQNTLTKPPGSLGRMEDLIAWLAAWQHLPRPRLDGVEILVFAGSHGIAARGVSAFPAEVTAQMVSNFTAGGAAINQIARAVDAELCVVPLQIDRPTADFTQGPAMSEEEFLAAVATGYDAVKDHADIVCLGEMGIANTTGAAALSAGLYGGDAADWVGRGTGVDDAGLSRKAEVVAEGLAFHRDHLGDPLQVAMRLGGRETAAMLGAALGARHRYKPIIVDGFVSTAAVAPLARLHPRATKHMEAGHVSAEAAHRRLLEQVGLKPLLDLGMRLGEGTGAALSISIIRAALACFDGMATFDHAGVSGKN
jgi:nicotinate-nucleotide--dimethylbenzimidazole phosphoribosyltransferase